MIMLSKRMAAAYKDKKKEESGNITYIYDEKHIKKRNRQKAKKVERLEKSISDLREQVRKDLKSDDTEKRLAAIAVGLIDDTYERVGNEKSAEQDHYGVTTWKVKHITFSGNKARIKYVGKSGVKQDKEVKQKSLVNALKDITNGKKKNDKVFETDDFVLTANEVNKYLKKFKVTAKDIRGFHANTEMRKALKSKRRGKLPKDEKEKTKKLKEEFKAALEEAAKKVGHEPGTLKNQYLIPSIEESFMEGKLASSEFFISKRAEIIREAKHTSAIVAIKVPEHIVKRLKDHIDEDTQPSNELHITLCFLGKSKDINKSTRKAMISALERVCSNYKPLSMYISGTGKFKKNDDGTPVFLIPNAIGLSRLQADIESTISNFIDLPSEHGWVPHITVQYAKDDVSVPDLKNFPKWKTDHIVLWFSGKEIAKIPLGKKQAFFISKRAQELELKAPGAQILIEPYDSAVAQALAKLPAELKQNVTKIIVHPEGGPGQLGHVEMGPGKDPREIHLFKNRINEQVKRMFGTTQPDPQQLEQATHRALVETLTHEGVHIGPATQEQILDPSYRFKDESGTEQETAQRMRTLFPEMAMSASLKLDDIRTKYLPSQPMTEPDLEFMVYCALDKKYDTVKKGISLLKKATINPAILEIKDAIEFNKQASRDRNVIRMIGALGTCTKPDEVLSLACWQLRNKLEPTGKLDRKTVQKFGKTITIYELPRNFGVVVPKQLYRGGIIENPLQIKNLKDRFGVERIISLHNHPEIGRMCREVGIEHIPAPIETGAPEEYGRKILGDKVSKLLLEKPTYIHCWYGADRTGGVIARFRTETGWPNKEAYLEAKSYGFKDMFADLIDWFCEVGKGSPPVNTRMIRRMLNRLHRDPNCPYRNPEISNDKDTYKKRIIRRVLNRLHKDPVEQDAFTPAGTPTDEPFRDLSETWPRYERWSDTVRSVNPVMTMTPPAGVTGH